MITFKLSQDFDHDLPLTWRNYRYQNKILECSPVIVCPNGHYLSIHKHTISEEGIVIPSVVCPINDCSFHEFIKLENYRYDKK